MSTMRPKKHRMLKQLSLILMLIFISTFGFAAKNVQAAVLVGTNSTLEGYNVDTKDWDGQYVTGNLGKSYGEGEWFPGRIRLTGFQGAYPSFAGMPDIQIKYDSVGSVTGGTAMFVDLVKGIQIGTRVLADTEAWPMANGLPYPMGSASNVALAQNHSGENQWAGYKLLNLPNDQMNRALDGTVGTIYENERMFIIKASDIIAALTALGAPLTTNDISIYFEFHLARTSIWSRNLQEYYTNEPAASWGGYIYDDLDFDPINFGSGPFPGSSGHFALANGGASDVPLPDTPEDYRTVTGMKFEDSNNNGKYDAGEPGIANWSIHLIGYIEDLMVPLATTTDGSGVYSFAGLSMGSILEVSEGNMAGYVQTYPNAGTDPLANGAFPVSISQAGRGPWGWKLLGSLAETDETVTGIDFGNFMPKPSMTVEKTGDAKSKAGDPVNYTIKITNTGNVPLSIDSVFDSRIGEIKGSFLAVIPVGQSSSATIPYTIPKDNTEDPFINKVTVKAHYLTYTVEGSASHSIDTFQPKIVIEKSVNKSEAIVGEKLTYTITVKNLSSTDTPKLTMTLTDALLGLNETFTMMPGDPNYVKVVDYIVKNTDPDPLNNTAKLHVTVEGFPNVYDLEASARVDIIHPKLSIVKSGDALSKLGDDTKFTFLVKNEGDVPLTIESVKDDPFGDITSKFTKPTLQPGDSELLTLYFPIPMDAPDPFVNKVSAVYKYGVYVASAESSHSVNLFKPDFTITKEVNKTEAVVGEELTYTITIDNLSSTDTPKLTFHVTDPLLGLDETFTMMPADANYVKVLKYTVKETDPNPLKNTAKVHVTVEGFPNFYDKEASASVKIIHPLIKITKTGDALSKIGDETKFVFEVKNIGDVPLTLVSVIDDPFMDITSKFTKPLLQPGESEIVTLYFKIPADASDPFTNKVTATYKYGSYTATSSASHDVNLFQPSIEITKTVDKKEAIIGEKVTYTITIKNTSSSDTPKMWFHLTDAMLGLDTSFYMNAGDPDYVKKIEYTIKETDPDPLDNTAKVHVTIEGFPNTIDKEASARVDIIHPHLTIVKGGDALSKKGDDTKFTFLVKNDGDVPLTLFSVVDNPFGDITAKFTKPLLAAGESELVTLYFPIPMDAPDPFVNKVTATYKYGSYITSGDSSYSVNLFQPSIEITKKVDKAEAIIGEKVTYTITIKNTSSSDTPKMWFNLTDALLGLDTSFYMNPGDPDFVKNVEYIIKETDPDPLVNTAKVHVTIEGFPNVIDKEASAKVDIIHPHLTIVKTGDLLSKIGDETKFVFNVKNDGDVPLTLFSVVDVPFGDITAKFTKPILLPGESEMVTLSFKIPADATDPFVNKVTATYKYGDYTATSGDSHEVNLFQPKINLTKSVDKSVSMVGDTLTYTLKVENLSSPDTPIMNFTLTDSVLGALPPFSLKSGEVFEKSYPYLVTALDPNPIINVAEVSASPEGFPNVYTDKESTTVKLFTPLIKIEKFADTKISKVGDTINYTIRVTNMTVEAYAPNLVGKVTDPMLGLDSAINLASGQMVEFKIPYIVKAADDPGGFGWVDLKNTATVTVSPLGFETISKLTETASATVSLVHPAIDITKDVDKTEAMVGETVRFTITIKNTGDVKLENLKVTDTRMGDISANFPSSLEVGQTATWFYDYILKTADISPDLLHPMVNWAEVHANPITLPNDIWDKDDASVLVKPAYYDETAWAFGGPYAVPFTDSSLFGSLFDKWGWTNGPLGEGDYEFKLYAGAGLNDLSKAIEVGMVYVSYHLGTAKITYKMYDGMLINQIHLYVGKLPLPKVKGVYTAAPGQFPINPKGVYGTTTWSITVKNLSGPIYVAAHMVVRIPGAVMPPILTPYYRPTV